MPKAKIHRSGVYWVAKSAKTWQEETGLSKKQYETALCLLKRLGLVVSEQHLFGGRNITFLRLTERWAEVTKGEPELPQEGEPEFSHMGEPLIQGDTSKSYVKELSNDSSRRVRETGASEGGPEVVATNKEGGSMTTVKELMDGATWKKPISRPMDGIPALVSVWQEHMAETYGGYQPAFTGKQTGQMKLFQKACPPGQCALVLDKVLKNWSDFVVDVKAAADLKSVPSQPNLDFLLKYVSNALQFVKAESGTKPLLGILSAQAKPEKVSLMTPKSAKVKADIATPEEVAAILNGE
jgi:hypothetical protein